MVWPDPMGRGVSTELYDFTSCGRKFVLGTARIALITLGERRMPCFIRLSISRPQSVFSNIEPH